MNMDGGPRWTRIRAKSRPVRAAAAALVAGSLALLSPAAALAHGPVAPIASAYLARIASTPAGTTAQAIDGDQRMWLRVSAHTTVTVLDYNGAPYLRFGPAGVSVNTSSVMWYLNQTPVAFTPPAGLSRATPPHWQPATAGSSYSWHDGRLHALAAVALTPGVSYVGRWRIPLLVDGRPATIAGGLYHADPPSLVWFWPAVVLLACVLAAWRVRRAELDRRIGRALMALALAAITSAALSLELHGRPDLTAFQLVKLVVVLALVAWGALRLARGQAGYFSHFVIGCGAVWAGIELLPTLLNGYVLTALPAFPTRLTAVLCLGAGPSLLLLFARLADRRGSSPESDGNDAEDDLDWEYA